MLFLLVQASLDSDKTSSVGSIQKSVHYPVEELDWIATTTFNRAVDFYCTSQDEACRRWAEKAISLATLGDDGGQLHQLLQNKYLGLAWDR